MNYPTLIRLIQFKAGYNLPVQVAIESGFFAKRGLKVEISYTPGSTYLMEALKTKEFEIGHIAADDLVAEVEGLSIGRPGGSDLFLFMGIHSGLLGLVGAPEVRNVQSLFGKAIAVDARASGFVFVLEKLLKSRGLKSADYQLVEVGGFESRYLAMLQGNYAATLLTQPYIGDALDAGFNLLARGDEIIPNYQGTCGVASRTWAHENEDSLVRYIQAYVDATRWCFDPKNYSDCLDFLAKYSNIKKLSAKRTLDALLDPQFGLYPKAELNIQGIGVVLELRAEMGFLGRPLVLPIRPSDVGKYIDPYYHQKAIFSD